MCLSLAVLEFAGIITINEPLPSDKIKETAKQAKKSIDNIFKDKKDVQKDKK